MSKKRVDNKKFRKTEKNDKGGKSQKKRKNRVIFPLLFLIVCFIIGAFIYSNRTKASVCVKEYFKLLGNKEYDKMYDLVSTDMSKDDFVNRVKNIYDGIEASDISITIGANSIDNVDGTTKVTYTNSMQTMAGELSFVNSCKVKEFNGKYKILWTSSVIYPDLSNDEKVRVNKEESTRGSLLDRNDIPIAKDGTVYEVGIVPGKLNEKEKSIKEISNLLKIDEEQINKSLISISKLKFCFLFLNSN